MGIAAALFTTYYKKALEKVGTRPTKPGDLLLPTRVPEWSHVRRYAIFYLSSVTVLVYCGGCVCTTKYKKDLKK